MTDLALARWAQRPASPSGLGLAAMMRPARDRLGFSALVVALGVTLALVTAPARAEMRVASVVAPPAVAEGASVPFIVSVDPPPDHRTDVLVHLSQVGAGVSGDDLGRRSLAVGPAGYAHLAVPTADDGAVGADGRLRAVLIGDGHTHVVSRKAGTATVQVRDGGSGLGRGADAPVISLTAPLSVAEGADVVVVLSASPLPQDPLTVELAVRERGPLAAEAASEDVEETRRTLTLGRDGFAQAVLATEDDDFADTDRLMVVEALPSSTGAYSVSHSAALARIIVLDDDWTHASSPYPTLSIVAPSIAYSDGGATFIVTANPPPPLGQSMTVPLRFAHESMVVEEGEGGENPLLFQQTGGAGIVVPVPLDPDTPVIELHEDGVAYVSFAGSLAAGARQGLVSAAIVSSADGAYRVSEAHGLASVRVFPADGGPTRPLPAVSIQAPESSFEGESARFLLFADPAPLPSESLSVTVRLSQVGRASVTGPDGCLDDGRSLCPVEIGDDGWGMLEISTVDDTEPSNGARLTATVVEPADAAYRPAAAASQRSATVRIIEDDGEPPPLPEVAVTAPNEIGEGGEARFLLTANPPPDEPLPVRLAITSSGDHVADEHIGLVGAGTGREPLSIAATGSAAGSAEWPVPTRGDDGQRGANGWVRAQLLRDDADPYRIAGADSAQVRIRDNGASPATPRLSIAAPRDLGEGGSATFLLSAVPPPASPLPVSVVVRGSGGEYLADGYDDPELCSVDPQQCSVERSVTIPVTGAVTLRLATTDDEENLGGGVLTAVIQASGASPPTYQIASGRASVRIQDDDPAGLPPAPLPPKFSVRPAVSRALAGSHAHFLLTADRPFDTNDRNQLPRVRMVIRAEAEQAIDPDRQRLLPLTSTGGCDLSAGGAGRDYAGLRDAGLAIPAGAVYLCVPVEAGDGAVTVTLGDTFDNDNYGTVAPVSARIAVYGDEPAAPAPLVSVIGPAAVAAGAVAGFVVSYTDPPEDDTLDIRVRLSGAVDGVERLRLPARGQVHFSVVVPASGGAEHLTATLVEPLDVSADGYYRADPNRSSARVAVVHGDAPLPAVSIAAPPTVARGGTTAFLLSVAPAPLQPIAATVASNAWRRIVPIDQRGVALLAVRADGESPYEVDGVLAGCLDDDPAGLYRLAGAGEACARIEIIEPNAQALGITKVSLTAPPAVGGGSQATLLLSADPPPGPSGVHVPVSLTAVSGRSGGLLPGETGRRTQFIGPDGIAFLRVRTQNEAGRFTATIPAASGQDRYLRDEAGHLVEVAVRAVGEGAAWLPTVAIAPGPTAIEGDVVEFTVASAPPTPGLVVGYRQSGGVADGVSGQVVLNERGRAVVRADTMDDGRSGPDQAVTITLLSGDEHRLEVGGATATVRVADDDAPAGAPRLSLGSAAHAVEGAPARFVLTADPPPKAPAVVALEIGQYGGVVADSRLGAMRLTLPASGYVRFSVPTLGNAVAGSGGKVTAEIAAPVRGLRIDPARSQASVAVVDDDGLSRSLPAVSLLAPSAALARAKFDLDIVADRRSPNRRLRVRVCLEGAGSFDPRSAVSHRWVRLDGNGQATLPLWFGEPDGGRGLAQFAADCPAANVDAGAVASGERQVVVRIAPAEGYRAAPSGSAAAVAVYKPAGLEDGG